MKDGPSSVVTGSVYGPSYSWKWHEEEQDPGDTQLSFHYETPCPWSQLAQGERGPAFTHMTVNWPFIYTHGLGLAPAFTHMTLDWHLHLHTCGRRQALAELPSDLGKEELLNGSAGESSA